MKKKFQSLVLLLLTFSLVSCSGVASLFATPTPTPTQTPTPTVTPTPFPLLGQTLKDVTYCTVGNNEPQMMDIYLPKEGGPWPTVIYIHGGSWMNGDKGEAKGLADWLNPLGYAVVSINYRMYPRVKFPSLIEDPKCAIRFLRANAIKYNLDPERFAAWGASAGGHLAALVGTSDASQGWDVGEYADQSSRVQAVVDMSGISNLAEFKYSGLLTVIMLAFGTKPETRLVGSPITYATSDDPPFLIIHGDRDATVPVEQGQAMYDALIKAGAPAKLVIVKGAGHDVTAADAPPTEPTKDEIGQMLLDFLEETLKSK